MTFSKDSKKNNGRYGDEENNISFCLKNNKILCSKSVESVDEIFEIEARNWREASLEPLSRDGSLA